MMIKNKDDECEENYRIRCDYVTYIHTHTHMYTQHTWKMDLCNQISDVLCFMLSKHCTRVCMKDFMIFCRYFIVSHSHLCETKKKKEQESRYDRYKFD